MHVIKETDDTPVLKKQDLYILLGTIFGVVVLVLVIVVILLIYFRRRHGSHRKLQSKYSSRFVVILYLFDAGMCSRSAVGCYCYFLCQDLHCLNCSRQPFLAPTQSSEHQELLIQILLYQIYRLAMMSL